MSERDEPLFIAIFDALPSMVVVVDQDLRIQECNVAALTLMMTDKQAAINRRAGNIIHCLHSKDVPWGCGKAQYCSNCSIRNSVIETFKTNSLVRNCIRLDLVRDGNIVEVCAVLTTVPLTYNDTQLALLVIDDVNGLAES